jgi:hypothetical protein
VRESSGVSGGFSPSSACGKSDREAQARSKRSSTSVTGASITAVDRFTGSPFKRMRWVVPVRSSSSSSCRPSESIASPTLPCTERRPTQARSALAHAT